MIRASRIRVATLGASLCVSLLAAMPIKAQMATFDIPAEDAVTAVPEFARQAGLQIIAPADALRGVRTQAIQGSMDVHAALKKLLYGTGLIVTSDDGRTISLKAQSKTAPASDQAPAVPRDDAANTTNVPGGRVELAEIIVTAEKREERLQETPVPVSVIGVETLVNSDQTLFRDYYSSIPGLSMTTTTQSGQILSIRGIVSNPGNPTVGITVDDVPFGSSTIGGGGLVVPDLDPGDLSRIEVLRGPQGTLYGASSLGGLIKFVTFDPSTAGVSGNVQAGVSAVHNGDEVGHIFRGAINVPLSGTLAVRASGFARLDPGYIDNPVLDLKGLNTARADGGLVSALWRPSSNFSLKVNAMMQEVKGDGSSDVDIEPGLGDLQQNYIPNVGRYDRRVQAYSATLKATLRNVDLVSITGYNINEFSDSWDYTFALAPFSQMQFGVPGTPIFSHNRTGKFTQEIRLSSSIGRALDWSVGAFYTHEGSQYIQDLLAENVATGAIVGSWCHCITPSVYKEYAVFPDLTYHATERLDVQVGARASRIRQYFQPNLSVGPYDPVFLGVPSPVIVPAAFASANPVTYLVTPRLRVSPDLMMYARLASGYRAGGSNQGVPGVPPEYGPDKTQDYDLGVKADVLDHTLSLDASIYYIKWKSIQLSFLDPQNFLAYTGNGGEAKSEGAELSITATPLPGLTIYGWVAYDDAALTQAFPAAVIAAGEDGNAGDRLPFSSRYSGYLSVDQKFPLGGDWTGFVGADMSYVGSRLGFFAATDQRTYFPGYAKVDLRGGVKFHSWMVNLFANNVGDKRAAIAGGQGYFPPLFAFQYIEPRLIGLNVSKAF